MARPAVRNRPIPILPPNVVMVPNPMRPAENTPRFIMPPSNAPPTIADGGPLKDSPTTIKNDWRRILGAGRNPMANMNLRNAEVFLKNLPASDWPRWEEARTEWQRCFYALCLAKLAQSADITAALILLQEKTRALSFQSFSRGSETVPVPGGFILICQNQVIAVIQGSTHYGQLDYYANNNTLSRVNFDLTTHTGPLPSGLGLWWEPFRACAIVWRSRLASALSANPGKQAIVIGHSVGAAVAEWLVAGDLDINTTTETALPRRIVAGIGFGCPRQYCWQAATRYLSAPHMLIYNHEKDPIPLFLADQGSNVPSWLRVVRAETPRVSHFGLTRSFPDGVLFNTHPGDSLYPTNFAQFMERVDGYHGIDDYWDLAAGTLLNRSKDTSPERWTAMKIAVNNDTLMAFTNRP